MEEKVFVISLHRTMTRSVDAYLSILGYRTIHYPKYIRGVNIEENFRGIEHLQDSVLSLLAPVIEEYDALSDIPFPVLYKRLAERWVNSRFILVHRDPPGWVKSVRNHLKDRALAPFDKIQYGPYLGFDVSRLKDVSDQQMEEMYLRHTREAERFFSETGEKNRLCVIRDTKNAAAMISDFLGKPVFDMPWITGGNKGTAEIPSLQYWKQFCPEKADPCYYLAKIYYEQGDYRRARGECEKAIELDPYYHKPRKLLSKINKKKKFLWIFRLKRSILSGHAG
ncbi:MAG: sulfotransferase [Thermodesulfobacteriota bacterium]